MQTEWTCMYCGGQGKVKYPRNTGEIETPALIVCLKCSKPSAYVWCDKCGMGGAIAENEFVDSPEFWSCMECGSTYELPKQFYATQFGFNPKRFTDPELLKKNSDIRNKRYITIGWVRNIILALKKHEKNLIGFPVAISGISMVGIFIVGEFLNSDPLFFVLLFLISSSFLGLLFVIWILTGLVDLVFLAIYKIGKYRN